MTVEIAELRIPEAPGSAGWEDFAQAIDVGNTVEAIGFGTPDVLFAADEHLTQFRNPFQPRRLLVARIAEVIVGRAVSESRVGTAAGIAWVQVEVLPEYQRRGIGTALAEALERAVREDGAAKAIAFVPDADPAEPRLVPPTGLGSVPATSRSSRFLAARGYRLEQVARGSRLPLPIDDIRERLAAAESTSGPDYRVHTWEGRMPEQWHADWAVMVTRMSTDAPTAGLEEPEDVWTAERVAESEDRRERENPRPRLVAAIEHVPTRRLVAFSILSVPLEPARSVAQFATLVLREHRGSRLGALVKLANLEQLERRHPGHPSVVTFNAEDNRPMLEVNEALGFVAITAEGAWRKDL